MHTTSARNLMNDTIITAAPSNPCSEALNGVAAELQAINALGSDAAPAPLRMLASRLEELELFQSRTGIVMSHVDDLIYGLEDGADLPPVLILRRGGRVFLIDGRHRKAAYELAGRGHQVPVEDFAGTTAEAVLEGQRRNRQHTLPMSHDERMDGAWKLVKLDASGTSRFTTKAIMANTSASRGQVTLMRKVLRELGTEGHEHQSWKKALRQHQRRPERTYSEDDIEAMVEAEARSGADKVVRALGKRASDRPEVLARIVEYYSGRRIHEVIRVLRDRNRLDEDDDDFGADF